MTRDQAQPGTQVTWDVTTGAHQTGTVLTPPADQSERVLVTWRDRYGQGQYGLLSLETLRVVPEVGR